MIARSKASTSRGCEAKLGTLTRREMVGAKKEERGDWVLEESKVASCKASGDEEGREDMVVGAVRATGCWGSACLC